MLTTRTISNTGEPLCAPDGTVLANVAITFKLMDPNGLFIDTWDATTYERVAGIKTVTTDVNGEFVVALWPNDRGSTVTQYLCHVDSQYVQDFISTLPSGPTGMSWAEFMGNALPLPPVVLDALALHVASPTAHPNATPLVNGFMSSTDKAKLDLLPGGGTTGFAFQAPAGEALGGHRAVILDAAGLAWYADRAAAADMFRIAGITQGAIALGGLANILSMGLLTEPSWAWTPDLPVFLEHSGLLTQTPPTDGFSIVLGVAIDATSMFVKQQPPLAII